MADMEARVHRLEESLRYISAELAAVAERIEKRRGYETPGDRRIRELEDSLRQHLSRIAYVVGRQLGE